MGVDEDHAGSRDPPPGPPQLTPPSRSGKLQRAARRSAVLVEYPRRERPRVVESAALSQSARQSSHAAGSCPPGAPVALFVETPCGRTERGFTGNGCVGEYHSPGTSPFGTGRSSTPKIGFPVPPPSRMNRYRSCRSRRARARVGRLPRAESRICVMSVRNRWRRHNDIPRHLALPPWRGRLTRLRRRTGINDTPAQRYGLSPCVRPGTLRPSPRRENGGRLST